MLNFRKHAVAYMLKKAESDKSASLASFELLLDNAVGIGDHSTDDLYKELDTALDNLVDAEDRLEIISKHLLSWNSYHEKIFTVVRCGFYLYLAYNVCWGYNKISPYASWVKHSENHD